MIIAIGALQTIVSLMGLLLLLSGPWQWYSTDNARQKLFMERNRLFDIAREGRISFDDPTYRRLRSHVESLVRFGHNLTAFRFLFIWARARNSLLVKNSDDLLHSISLIEDDAVRREFAEVYDNSGRIIVLMLAEKSVVAVACIWVGYNALRPLLNTVLFGRKLLLSVASMWTRLAQTAHWLPTLESAGGLLT